MKCHIQQQCRWVFISCDLSAQKFLHVEFNKPLVEHSLCYKLVRTRSLYYFSVQRYGILKTMRTSNLKAHNNGKMAVKEKETYFNII